MIVTIVVIVVCFLNGMCTDSTTAYRRYYTSSEEHISAKQHLRQYLNSLINLNLKQNNTLSVVTSTYKGAPSIDTDDQHIPALRTNPFWSTIELSNVSENLPLEAYLHTHSDKMGLHGLATEQSVIDEEEYPLSDESFPATIPNYNKENIPKCPEGLIFHQTIDNKISCYKITDATTFPPPCPYPLNVDYYLFKNIYNTELTNKIVWAFAKRNTYSGAYEWINYIHNNSIISSTQDNPHSRTLKKNCMVINGTELTAVNCQEKYPAICIYNYAYSTANNYCTKKFKANCFSSNLGVADKCYCMEIKDTPNQSRNSFCNKLGEAKDPYQNLIITNYLKNNVCYFGLDHHNWVSDYALVKYSFWSNNTDFTKSYGAITYDGWILEDDRKLKCAVCEDKISDYKGVTLNLLLNFTSKKVQLEIYNPIETFHGVTCFIGSRSKFIDLKTAAENYFITDVWSYDQLTENSWCKSLQVPNMDLIFSNMIVGNNNKGNEFAVTWSFPVSVWDKYEKSCPIINNGIVKLTRLVKILELREENKIRLCCHIHTVPSGLNISEDLKILKNLVLFENMTLENVASVKVCLASETMSSIGPLHWPETNIGSTVIAQELCMQDSDSPATRTCGGSYESGAQWLPVNGSCAQISLSPNTVYLNGLLHSSPTVNTDLSRDLSIFTEDKTNLDTFQIHLVSQILESIAAFDNISIKDVVSTVNHVMQFEPRNLRGSQVTLNSTDIILWSLDEILLHTDTESSSSGYISEGSEMLLIQATNLVKTDIKGFRLQPSNLPNFDPSKLEALHQYQIENELEKDLDLLLIIPADLRNDVLQCTGSKDTPNLITSMFYNDVLFNENDNVTGKCDGKVVSVLLPGFNCSFSSPIQIIFKSNAELNSEVKCASWVYGANKFMESIHGHWSVETTPKNVGNSNSYKLCEFYHTTHFALLVLGGNNTISEGHKKALDIITAVGSGLSLLGLLAIFLTAIIFKSYRTTNGIVINFSFAMTAQIILLFIAGSVADDPTLCTVFGALLHYAVLSEFFWMLTIAVLQYQRFVIIFSNPPTHLVAKSCLFSWGLPLIPVIVTVSISTDNYGANSYGFCYALGNYFTFGVIVPVSIIILINLIIFLRIMVSLVSSRRIKVHQDKDQASVLQLRLAFMLYFLLGLTWGFGLFANLGGGLAYSYLFCLTATLQGFVLFIFFIVLNEKTRSLWVNMKTCWCKSDEYDVTQDSAASVMVRRNKTISTDTCTDSATSEILRKVKSRNTSEF